MNITDSDDQSSKLKTTPDILAHIHHSYLKGQLKISNSLEWDCVRDPGIHRDERDKEQNEWMDAAYMGDWDALLKIAVRTNWEFAMGRLANVARLRPTDSKTSWKPSSYTALHQAAYYGAPLEIVEGLIELGSSRGLRTTDGKNQRPLDIAYERGHRHLYDILIPTGLPDVTEEELSQVEAHFHKVIAEEARGIFKPESMRYPPLGLLRDHPRVWMPDPGMYGGFTFWWDSGHLVTESYCRVCGGSGRTNHITVNGAELVAEGWG